jgi:hypothetical protein
VVYIARNIKDSIVSMYKMLSNFKMEPFDGTFEDMVDIYIEGKIWFGSWWSHIDQYSTLSNTHFMHYENLLEVFRFSYHTYEKKKCLKTLL